MAVIGTQLLAGDVGGTKTALSLFERTADGWIELAATVLSSAVHKGLEAPARVFLEGAGVTPQACAFGVAGPVVGGRCQTTNLPWTVDARALASSLGVARVAVVNDFEATARGLLELGPEQLVVLQEGDVEPGGHAAVLGAGTGLGEAILLRTERGARVLSTEGGHTDFAPRNEEEDGLLRFLRQRHGGRVSVERAVSGPGLAALHAFVLEGGLAKGRADTLVRMQSEDPGTVIGELGAAGSDPACAKALSMFVSLYGAEAGNLALKTLPTAGVYVAGGIAPRILPTLREGGFLAAFLDKGRMRPLLERVRVSVVTDARVGLYGARAIAASLT